MELAACAGMSIDVFFPFHVVEQAAAAHAVCSTCKVQPECLDYERSDSDTMGFWGGASERDGGTRERWRRFLPRLTFTLTFRTDLVKGHSA